MPDQQISLDPEITDPLLIEDIPVISAGINKRINATNLNSLIQAEVDLNTAKNTYPSADATKVGHISVTQAVDLDTMESDIVTNNAKLTYPAADATTVGFITATQSIDLDNVSEDNFGVFTPTIQDDSLSNGEGQTYTVQNGTYEVVGSTVFFRARLVLSSAGTLTGAQTARMGGLPFASTSTANTASACYVGQAGAMAITAGHSLGGYINPNTDYIVLQLWDATTGTTDMTVTEFSLGNFMISGHYTI